MVQRQVQKWPGTFKASTTAVRIRDVLMDPQYGFTKPKPSSPIRSLSPLTEIPDDQSMADIRFLATRVQTLSDANKPTDDLEIKHVKLLIEDARAPPSPFKISQDVVLAVVDRDFCAPGEWRADLHELLVKLQLTNAALAGLHPQLRI